MKLTGTLPSVPDTTTYGIPFGAPSHTVPKSGCSPLLPQLAISADEFASTGSADTSMFHGLSEGNGRRPCRLASMPSAGVPGAPESVATVGVPFDGAVSAALHASSAQPASRGRSAVVRIDER